MGETFSGRSGGAFADLPSEAHEAHDGQLSLGKSFHGVWRCKQVRSRNKSNARFNEVLRSDCETARVVPNAVAFQSTGLRRLDQGFVPSLSLHISICLLWALGLCLAACPPDTAYASQSTQ